MSMTSSRPYLIRALYEWILDNDFTPHLVVFAQAPNVEVPQEFVNKDGQIVLNIAPRAVEGLELGNKAVTFRARFGGVPTDLYIPCYAVMGIVSRENGQGMMFEMEAFPEPEPEPEPPTPGDGKRPSLRVVK